VENIIMTGNKTYEQASDEIREILYSEQAKKKFETWLESLKEKAHIKLML
jgi:thymidine phosphorylase